MANGDGGRCPGRYEREALAKVARAKRKDQIAARLEDFLRGLMDDPDTTGNDMGDLSDLVQSVIRGDDGKRKDFL